MVPFQRLSWTLCLVSLSQLSSSPARGTSVSSLFADRLTKEAYPRVPIARSAELKELVLVFGSSLQEPRRERDGWLTDRSRLQKLQDDDETTKPAIAICERVQRLELVVSLSGT